MGELGICVPYFVYKRDNGIANILFDPPKADVYYLEFNKHENIILLKLRLSKFSHFRNFHIFEKKYY